MNKARLVDEIESLCFAYLVGNEQAYHYMQTLMDDYGSSVVLNKLQENNLLTEQQVSELINGAVAKYGNQWVSRKIEA